jgi:hypothetical protein
MPAHLNRTHKSVVAMADPLKADWALLGQNRTTLLAPSVTEGPYCECMYQVEETCPNSSRCVWGMDSPKRQGAGDGYKLASRYPGRRHEYMCSHAKSGRRDLGFKCHSMTPAPIKIRLYANLVSQGVYSGVLDFLDMNNKANINNRALRGVQVTDKGGAVQFETIIPGHYLGRTNHIHGKYEAILIFSPLW